MKNTIVLISLIVSFYQSNDNKPNESFQLYKEKHFLETKQIIEYDTLLRRLPFKESYSELKYLKK